MTDDTTRDTRRRGPTGQFQRTTDTARRDAEAAELRSQGQTYQAIADRLGFANRTNSRRAVERALAATVREAADEVRALQLAQLDRLTREALAVLEREHLVVSHGRIINGPDGKPLMDDAPVLQAIDRLIRIQERRAKLLGLDAPTKVETWNIDAIDAEIRRLQEQLADNDSRSGTRSDPGFGGDASDRSD